MRKLFKIMNTMYKRVMLSLILASLVFLYLNFIAESEVSVSIFLIVYIAVPIFIGITLFYAVMSTFVFPDDEEPEPRQDILDH